MSIDSIYEFVFCTCICAPKAPSDHGFDKALAACEKSLVALRRSHLDLYLIHWPGVQGRKREDPHNAALRKESWRALEQLYSEGRSGVCMLALSIEYLFMCVCTWDDRESKGNRSIKLYSEALERIANICHS